MGGVCSLSASAPSASLDFVRCWAKAMFQSSRLRRGATWVDLIYREGKGRMPWFLSLCSGACWHMRKICWVGSTGVLMGDWLAKRSLCCHKTQVRMTPRKWLVCCPFFIQTNLVWDWWRCQAQSVPAKLPRPAGISSWLDHCNTYSFNTNN